MDRYRTIKASIGCFLLAALLGIIFPLSFAQQNQTTSTSDPEVETLKKRISELESKLQTVENVEKMELAAKLADANAKLLNAEIDRFKRELKDANDEWLRTWSLWFVGITGFLVLIVGGAFWFWLRSRADQLIANSVEERLDGFRDAVEQVNILKNELRILQKEHAVSMLENSHRFSADETYYREQIKTLPEKALLDVFEDEARSLLLRHKAAEALANRKCPQLVSPALIFLYSVVNSDLDGEDDSRTKYLLRDFVSFVGYVETLEAYQGLKEFLHRLLTEDLKHKDVFLTDTVFSIVSVSTKLNMRDSVSILKTAISHLNVRQLEHGDIESLAAHFDMFNEPAGIKEILIKHLTIGAPDVEVKCLELLQKHDPDFVKEWQAQKEAANTKTEESS